MLWDNRIVRFALVLGVGMLFLWTLFSQCASRPAQAEFLGLRANPSISVAKKVVVGESIVVQVLKEAPGQQTLLPGATSSAAVVKIQDRTQQEQKLQPVTKFFFKGKEITNGSRAGVRLLVEQNGVVSPLGNGLAIPAQGTELKLYVEVLPGLDFAQFDEIVTELRRPKQKDPVATVRVTRSLEVRESVAFERLPDPEAFGGVYTYGVPRNSLIVLNNWASVPQDILLGFQFKSPKRVVTWKDAFKEAVIRVRTNTGDDFTFDPSRRVSLPPAKNGEPSRVFVTWSIEFLPGEVLRDTEEILFSAHTVLGQ